MEDLHLKMIHMLLRLANKFSKEGARFQIYDFFTITINITKDMNYQIFLEIGFWVPKLFQEEIDLPFD